MGSPGQSDLLPVRTPTKRTLFPLMVYHGSHLTSLHIDHMNLLIHIVIINEWLRSRCHSQMPPIGTPSSRKNGLLKLDDFSRPFGACLPFCDPNLPLPHVFFINLRIESLVLNLVLCGLFGRHKQETFRTAPMVA